MEVYTKQGRRYYKLGYTFEGFPANGVWLVKDGHQNLIMKVGDIPDPMPLAQLQLHEDAATRAIVECSNGEPVSAKDIWDRICMAIAKKLQEEDKK